MNGQRQHRSDKSCEWAALAALDALTPEESAAYQEHLKGGCPVCEAAVRSFEEVAGQLGAASPPVRPSALLKGRLMTRISEGTASNAPRDWGPTNGPTTGQPRFSRFVISSLGTEESQTRPGAKSTSWGRWLSAAAVFFVVCAGLWMAVQTRPAPYDLDRAAQETYIDSLYAQVAAAIRVGLGDHVHCSFFRKFAKDPPTFDQMAKKMGPDWVGLVPLVEERVPDEYRVMLAHRCGYRGRKFVHLALQSDEELLSVVITEKRAGDAFSRENLISLLDRSGISIYGQGVERFQTAGFESRDYLAFVVSDLTREGNLKLAASLAPAVSRFLARLEA